jgi:hypothetical protein
VAYWLVPILFLSLAYLGYFALRSGGAARSLPGGATSGQVDKAVTLGYLLLSTAAIAGLLVSHLAMPGPAVSRSARHVEFRGVAVTVPSVTGDMSNVRISGDPVNADSEVQRGFRWSSLPFGAIIDLRPDQIDADQISSYRAIAKHVGSIVRLNGRCINDVVGGWIQPGQLAQYTIDGDGGTGTHVPFELTIDKNRVQVGSAGHRSEWLTMRSAENLRSLLKRADLNDLASPLSLVTDARGVSSLDALFLVRYERGEEDSVAGLLTNASTAPAEGDSSGGFAIRRTDGLPTPKPPSIPATNGKFSLEADGAGGRDRLSLPRSLENTSGGQVRLRFLFDPPQSYPLLPPELLRTMQGKIALSSSTNGPNVGGYLFDTGNLNESYTTFAALAPDGTSLTLASEREGQDRQVEPNQDRLLGDGAVVPIYALVDPLKGKQGVVVAPLGSIFVGLVCCVFGFVTVRSRRGGVKRLPRDLIQSHAAFVVWVIAVTLLVVRAVLAFRVSLLPPFNMDASSAASFRACWPRAWTAILAIPPLLGVLTFIAVRAKGLNALPAWALSFGKLSERGLKRLSDRPWLRLGHIAYGLAFLVAMAAFLEKYLHLPLPDYVLIAVMLVVLGLVCEGVSQTRDGDTETGSETTEAKLRAWLGARPQWLRKVATFFAKPGLALLATSVLALTVDPGTFVFFLPLAVAVAVGAMSSGFGTSRRATDQRRRPTAKVALVGLALACVLGLLFSAPVGTRLLTSPLLGKFVGRSSFPYRLVALDAPSAEHLLVDPATRGGVFSPLEMQQTLHQRWEMLTYVKASPTGYFGAPLSKVGMTYPTMVSDAVFSIFLVGEHGRTAGAMVIALILTLCLALFRTAWLAVRSRTQRWNARGLYAIASVIGGSALYMSLANVWVVPFTGQNMPFLSLVSREDLVLNTGLVIAALLLIAFPSGMSAQIDREAGMDARKHWLLWWAYPIALATGLLGLAFALGHTEGDPTQPYNLRTDTLEAIQDRISRAAAESAGGRLPLAQTAAVKSSPTFVRSMFEAYAQGAVSRTPFVSDRGGSRLTLDKAFFLAASPFSHDDGVAWHGSLLAHGIVERRQLIIGGSRASVILEPNAGVAEITLGLPLHEIRAQTIEIRQRLGRPARFVDYGGVTLSGEDVVIRWRTSGKPGALLINGERPKQKLNEHVLQPSDRVSLEYTGADGVAQKLSIQYPGPSEAALAEVGWRNGKYLRTFPQGVDFPLAYTIGEIADSNVRDGRKIKDVTLSLDLPLQRDLQALLRSWGREKSRLIDSGAKEAEGLPFTAVSVLDSSTGGIQALASIPQCDPADDPASIRNRFPSEREALIASRSSWTFVNRTIGSTIKPLTYSALSTQLNHDGFDLGTLHVNEQAAVEEETDSQGVSHRAYRKLGDIELKRGKRLGGKENPRADVDMTAYLRDSRTWPAIVTSTIGLVASRADKDKQKQELQALLTTDASGTLEIGGRRVAFRPRLALQRLFAPDGSLSSLELDDTAYFRGIQSCFGPGVAPFNADGADRWDDGLDKNFYAPLDASLARSTLESIGLPDVHRTDTTNLTDLDSQLVRYMIGSGECRWNAVTMATNAARIMTGMKVQPTLSGDAKPAKTPMPSPINNFSRWRRPRILEPLMHITTIPQEYLAKIHSALPANYRIAMKTGTIDDGALKNSMESEMLMFTVGEYSETTGFVPGHCVSGFISIRSSKKAEGDDMVKGDLAARVIPIVVAHLKGVPAK